MSKYYNGYMVNYNYYYMILLTTGYFLGNLDVFYNNLVGDIVIIVILMMLSLAVLLDIEMVSVVVQSYSNICERMLNKNILIEEDITYVIESYARIKPCLSWVCFVSFIVIQLNCIIGIYMTIIGRNEFPPLLVSLSFLLYFIVMLNDLLAV